MKGPFPGMDPYLERRWADVQSALLRAICDGITPALPAGLTARFEEQIEVEGMDYARARSVFPDLIVHAEPGRRVSTRGAVVSVGTRPAAVELESRERAERHVEVADADGEPVAVVVVLRPIDKMAGPGRERYRDRREEWEAAGVHHAEVDLIRAGSWRRLLSPGVAPARAESDYRVLVRRAVPPGHRRRIELHPISLREKLPPIPVPLRPADRDLVIDLQPALEAACAAGQWGRAIYRKPLDPPLDPRDAAWAAGLVAGLGA